MIYKDNIYGDIEITEPVILELIESSALQRLKGIDQAGYREPFLKGALVSRFEHSVGVFILLKKYRASIEEQISGLIHDVSHSAFSHCIDYVLSVGSGEKQDHQDNISDNYIKKSDIPEILNKYGFDLEYILDDRNFVIKETNLPDLCADRIDYSLRDAFAFGEIASSQYILDNLEVKNSRWVFKDFDSANYFAQLFYKLNKNYYSGLPSAAMFLTLSDYLRYSLSKMYISEADLYMTDKFVINKINLHLTGDSKLKLLFERLNNKIGIKNSPSNYDGKVVCKSRIVDPLCSQNGKTVRVSEVNPDWKMVLAEESKPKEYFLKFAK